MAKISSIFKPLLFVVVTFLFLAVTPQLSSAATTPDGFEYTTTGSEATITGYIGSGGNVTIPETINDGLNTYTLIGIGAYAFNTNSTITGVTLPNSVIYIGEYAFQGCNLSSISIPDSVNSIGVGVFGFCNNLSSVTLGTGTNSISPQLFQSCISLTDVTIPYNITSIGFGAFQNCTGLSEVTIPNSVTVIGQEAFKSCSSLISITIPDNITSIDNLVFQNCTGLQSVSIPIGVTDIGGNSFERCTSLQSVTFPDTLTSIGDAAFCECTDLTEAKFLGNAPNLGNIAFENCASNFTVLCLEGKDGFAQLWYGYPTATFEGSSTSMAITNCVPSADSTIVPADQTISIAFDHNVSMGASYNDIVLTDGNGSPVNVNKTLAGNLLQLDPLSDLLNGVAYSVSIPQGCVIGDDGTLLILPYTFNFTVILPLEVIATEPSPDEQDVAIDETIEIFFNTGITEGFNFYDILLKDTNNYAITSYKSVTDNKLVIDPVWDLQKGMTYTVLIPNGSIVSQGGVSLGNDYSFSFRAITDGILALEVSSTDPSQDQTNVSTESNITVSFNQSIIAGDQYNIISLQTSSGQSVAIAKSISMTTLVLDPIYPLVNGATYTVSVPAGGVRSTEGAPLADDLTFSFTTYTVGTLEVIDSAPADGSTDVDPGTSITITFGEDIATGNSWDNISLQDANGNGIGFERNINGPALTIDPYDDLAKGMTYTVYLPNGSIEGSSGSSLTSAYSFGFTTVAPTESDVYEITTSGNNATITAYTGPGGEITIPDRITKEGKTYNITGIGYESFGWRDDITVINIPDSITDIDVWAFNMSVNLAELNVSNGNKKYSSVDGVLYNKSKDTLVCYPPGGNGSFAIPNYVKTIGDSAFTFTGDRLYEIAIPNSVRTIGNHAFENNAIADLIIPAGVTSIGDNAFANCVYLSSLDIPGSVTSIGDYAFSNCSGATELTIGNGVNKIGENAFSWCGSLTEVVVPDSVTDLGIWAFADCGALNRAVIGNKVTEIGANTFEFCGSLSDVKMGRNVKSIGPWAFTGCGSLSTIVIPNTVTTIWYSAFEGAGLTNIDIPSSVTTIREYAFNACYNLQSITIPDSVTSLGIWAFADCSSLESVVIGNGVPSIGECAFQNCTNLQTVKLGKSVNEIGAWAFIRCTNLSSINFPNSLISIGEAPFEDCSSLTNLVIPNSVTGIGIYAFNRCSSLESVNIPKNMASLSEGIFQGCSGLTSITIPKGIIDIGSYAFYTCSGLEEARFLGNAPEMGDQVFDECAEDFKVYYMAGSDGFTDPWYGYPTEVVKK